MRTTLDICQSQRSTHCHIGCQTLFSIVFKMLGAAFLCTSTGWIPWTDKALLTTCYVPRRQVWIHIFRFKKCVN